MKRETADEGTLIRKESSGREDVIGGQSIEREVLEEMASLTGE